MIKPVGQTKAAGFEFGIRKTFSIQATHAWDFLLSKQGIEIWLGEGINELRRNEAFETRAGISGIITVFKPESHLRMRWQKKSWTNTSIFQLRVIDRTSKTVISFHQDKLLDSTQRAEMKEYWTEVIKKISTSISG